VRAGRVTNLARYTGVSAGWVAKNSAVGWHIKNKRGDSAMPCCNELKSRACGKICLGYNRYCYKDPSANAKYTGRCAVQKRTTPPNCTSASTACGMSCIPLTKTCRNF
jgi:hypothetical protein